ncbi:MAG: hypothetical protein DRN83_00615 [Hadesarchaea archaeon]|nr:MAG: hypothetical protein DRN83_00615 [Hadesarchaea archaeon]
MVISVVGVLSPSTTPVATAAAPTVTLEPTSVQDNGYVLFTLTVTNPSDSNENIENILIKDVSSGTSGTFSGGKFGENVAERWENIADNLTFIGNELGQVSDNIEEARVKLTAAGDALKAAAGHLDTAGYAMRLLHIDNDNVARAGENLQNADDYLTNAGEALKADPVSFLNVAENLRTAAYWIWRAGWVMSDSSEATAAVAHAGDNLELAAYNFDNYVDNAFEETVITHTYDNLNGLENIAAYFLNAGQLMRTIDENAGAELENVAVQLLNAAENLQQVQDNLAEAGVKLHEVENKMDNARAILSRTGRRHNDQAFEYLWSSIFDENIRYAGLHLENQLEYENIVAAGEALENSTEGLIYWLGTVFGSNILGYDGETATNTVRYWIQLAGNSLSDNDNIGLTAAAGALDNAAPLFTQIADKFTTASSNLSPVSGWGSRTDEGGLLLVSLGEEPGESHDNAIKPGDSKTFQFYWRAPDISSIEEHTIRVWLLDNDNDVVATQDFTVTVDGEPASIDMRVYQPGVVDYLGNPVDNVVGKRLNDNKAILEIVASKPLSNLGTIKFENWKSQGENFEISFSDLTTTDNMTFTYEFDVSDWNDNAENVHVHIAGPSSTTSVGVENENSADLYFFVDLVDPVFVGDNGLSQFGNLLVMQKLQTDNTYYVTTQRSGWVIKGRAEDNDNVGEEGWEPGANPDNALWAMVTVYVNDVAVDNIYRLPDDNYSANVTLQEGVNVIKVVVKDRVGNAIENIIDNVYVDNTKPVVEFVSVGGVSWTENEVKVGDNKPLIKLRIYDPGFEACTGLGIPRDNLAVHLDNDDNIVNGVIFDNLDNNAEWENGVSTFYFENLIDNDNKGLAEGTWYVIVQVSDNLHENENHVMSFVVDVTEPSAPANVTGSVTAGGTAASKSRITTTEILLSGTGEAGATIKVEISTDNGVTWTEQTEAQTTIDSSGNWNTTVTVTEGVVTGIRVKVVDTAGNESAATVFGYVLSDSSAPTVTITSPAEGLTTDAASVTITGTVTKDDWESWNDLTMTVQVGTNSVTVPLSGPTFSYSVALSEGVNTILVSVSDGLNTSGTDSVNVTRTVTPWATYAIIIVIVALILAAIAIFRKR